MEFGYRSKKGSRCRSKCSKLCCVFFFFFFQEALRNGLVATEVLMWFYIGEIIGKRGLIGYNV